MRLTYANPPVNRVLSSPEDGTDRLVWLAESEPDAAWQSEEYYEKRKPARRINRRSKDRQLAQQLGDLSAGRCSL